MRQVAVRFICGTVAYLSSDHCCGTRGCTRLIVAPEGSSYPVVSQAGNPMRNRLQLEIPRGRGRPDTVLLWPPLDRGNGKKPVPSSRLKLQRRMSTGGGQYRVCRTYDDSNQTTLIARFVEPRAHIPSRSFDLRGGVAPAVHFSGSESSPQTKCPSQSFRAKRRIMIHCP
jgi:hypothetical protein